MRISVFFIRKLSEACGANVVRFVGIADNANSQHENVGTASVFIALATYELLEFLK